MLNKVLLYDEGVKMSNAVKRNLLLFRVKVKGMDNDY